ncbi:hypothetical protein JYT16_00500 [Gemmatimonas aurantiaca]|nr:hypothetical protein [Gemmatimonas aurantiaca]
MSPNIHNNNSHRLREIFISFSAALFYSAPFLVRMKYWGIHDWELFTAMGEIPRTLIFQFGQFPFWNPYIGGGNILFHHPEVAVLSPLYLLPLLFGAVVGLKLMVFVCYFLGFWGSVRFARALNVSELGAYLFSAIYFGGTYFAMHFAEGHIPFTHFCFLPWIGYFWLRSLSANSGGRKNLLWGALMMALMILGNGAAAPFLLTVTFLSALCAIYCFTERSVKPALSLMTIVFFGVALAAIKFVPMLNYLLANPWVGEDSEVTPIAMIPAAFFGFEHSLYSFKELVLTRGWHEYSAYISPLAILLGLWFLIRKFRAGLPWLALAALFFVIGLGGFAEWSPWTLLSHLPGYASSRSPARLFQFVTFAVGILAAFGFDQLRREDFFGKLKPQMQKYSIVTIIAIIAGCNLLLAHQSLSESFVRLPVETSWNDEFKQRMGDPFKVYLAVKENRGTISAPWLSAYQEGRGLVTPEGQILNEYALSGRSIIDFREFNGNEILIRIASPDTGALALGMGFDPGWKVIQPEGWEVREEQGLVAIAFGAGKNMARILYRPPLFGIGLTISLLACALFGFLFWRWR